MDINFRYDNDHKEYIDNCKKVQQFEEKITKEKEGCLFSEYINSLFLIIEEEYDYKNLNRARFNLRKILLGSSIYEIDWNRALYWAVMLDEIPNLFRNEQWVNIKGLLTDQKLLSFAKVYEKIYKRTISKLDIVEFAEVRHADRELEKKKSNILSYVKLLIKDGSWKREVINNMDLENPDALSAVLYSKLLMEKDRKLSKEFWRENFIFHADKQETILSYWDAVESKESNSNLNIKIAILGGGNEVGGSCIVISDGVNHLMVDGGMYIDRDKVLPDFAKLSDMGISLEDLDCVLVSHAHLDHTGALPYIYKNCPNINIYATEPTQKLMKVLMKDLGRSVEENTYSSFDVENMLSAIHRTDYNNTFTVAKGIEVTYFNAGHILGAACIYINFKGKKILYTGDFSVKEQNTVEGLSLPEELQVDVLITETTYGYMPKRFDLDRKDEEKRLLDSIVNTVDQGGTALLPAFAVGRSQELLMILIEAFKEQPFIPFNIYLDGRVEQACAVYQEYAEKKKYIHPRCYRDHHSAPLFESGGIELVGDFVSDIEEKKSFIEQHVISGGKCIVASSGMLLEGSASHYYAKKILDNPLNTITFSGYLAPKSPGWEIVKAAREEAYPLVKIGGEVKEVNARIDDISLSAHASREEILSLVIGLKPKQVFLVHGDADKAYSFIDSKNGSKIYPSILDCLLKIQELKVVQSETGSIYSVI